MRVPLFCFAYSLPDLERGSSRFTLPTANFSIKKGKIVSISACAIIIEKSRDGFEVIGYSIKIKNDRCSFIIRSFQF